MVRLFDAEFLRDRDLVAALFVEYGESLDFKLCFQGFDRELAGLPGAYAAPRGCVLLAELKGDVVGCVALRPLGDDGVCEMKRLYVKPVHRGLGAGRMLAEAIVERARSIGYQSMRLDTIGNMHAALAIYERMGFEVIEAYYNNPMADVVYMELQL